MIPLFVLLFTILVVLASSIGGDRLLGIVLLCRPPPHVVKSAKAGLREQEVRRTGIPRAERRPAVQAKRSGEQLLASS